MENRDALLIRKMISLVESVNDKLENEDPNIEVSEEENPENIEEQVTKVAQQGIEAIGSILKSEKGLFRVKQGLSVLLRNFL